MAVIVINEEDLRSVLASELDKRLLHLTPARPEPAPDPFEWVTHKEAMRLLGVSKSTLRRRTREGRIRAKKVGRAVYFKRSGLSALIEAGDAPGPA